MGSAERWMIELRHSNEMPLQDYSPRPAARLGIGDKNLDVLKAGHDCARSGGPGEGYVLLDVGFQK